MKYSERLVEKIVMLIEEDTYTIGEICDALDINRKTFYEWKNTKAEFRRAIYEAEDRRDDALASLARKSLREKIEGCIVTTEKITYIDDGYGGKEVKARVVTQKKCPPDTRAIKLALDRQDKKREKEEAKEGSPERHPIVLKFPKEIDPEFAIDTVTTFVNNVKNDNGKPADQENDDDSKYTSVFI